MIVTCEKCGTRFGVDENLIKESGSKVRCSKCRHTFSVYKPVGPEEEGTLPGLEEEALDQPEGVVEEPPFAGAGEEGLEVSESLEESLDLDLFESEEEDGEAFSLEDLTLDEAFGPEGEEPGEEVPAEEPTASDEEMTVGDLGFEEELTAEELAEPTSEIGATMEEAEEEMALEELSLEEEAPLEEVMASGEGVLQEEDMTEEGDIAFEDLLLEEESGEAGAKSLEDWSSPEEEAEEEIGLDDLSLEEGETDEGFMEEGLLDEETVEGVEGDALEQPEAIAETPVEEAEAAVEPAPFQEGAPGRRRISLPVLVLLVVVLVGGAAYAAFTVLKSLDVKIPFLESLTGAEKSETIDPGNMYTSLLEQQITSDFVDNKSVGSLFVIKGKVRNDYPEPRNFIRVKGVLYLKNGKVAQNRIVYCGNMLSDAELESIDRLSIKKRLSNRFGDNKSNFRVPPGKDLPFMVVFYDIPPDLGEFSVEVVDSASG